MERETKPERVTKNRERERESDEAEMARGSESHEAETMSRDLRKSMIEQKKKRLEKMEEGETSGKTDEIVLLGNKEIIESYDMKWLWKGVFVWMT